MKTVLTIAGSDCSGGAGIQADLKTIAAHARYGMSAITALTAQNTTGVYGVLEVAPEFVGKQLDAIFTDIRPDAVKIGMVSNREIIRIIAEKLRQYDARNIVADPVMVATSGSRLLDPHAIETLQQTLLSMSDVLTPNILEAQILSGISITGSGDMEKAAEIIAEATGAAVVLKGGHLTGSADDLLYDHGLSLWIKGNRIQTKNTHGTGCTLSSAIACNLAGGHSLKQSVILAKEYVSKALESGLQLGSGSGPLNHCYAISSNSPLKP